MKKLIPVLVLALATSTLFAQITVTNATFPTAGDTLKMAIDNTPSGLVMTSPGGPFNWDFTGLTADLLSEIVYFEASAGSIEVPGAELFANLGGGTESYFNVTATAVELMAVKGPDPQGFGVETTFFFTPPIVQRRAPMTFPSSNLTSSSLLIPFAFDSLPPILTDSLNLPFTPDSIRVRITTERNDFVDAYGNLAIPGGAYEVLREKRTEFREARVDVLLPGFGWQDVTDLLLAAGGFEGIGKDTVVTYNFFSNTEKEIIASVTVDSTELNATTVTFKNNGLVSAIAGVESAPPTVTVSPNPFSGEANFALQNFATGKYTLQVFDTRGQAAYSERVPVHGNSEHRINLSQLGAGSYFFRFVSAQGSVVAAGQLLKTQ
ncbi:MAG: T9SS type A sorting domain-containing protein [Saprospiraceae bacterium]